MSFLTLLALLSLPATAAPALVTAADGPVQVDGEAAPAAPFVLAEDAALVLGEGASVVVLAAGHARRVATSGPVDLAALGQAPAAQAAALDGLLSHQVDTSRVGATRAGPGVAAVRLVRPVPGAPVLDLPALAWRCDGTCPDAVVDLAPFPTGEAVLTCTTSPCAVPADALSPGPWAVRIDGTPLAPFTVPGADEAARLTALVTAGDAAADTLPAEDVRGRASVRAAVRWQAGLPGDALAVLDAALAADPPPPADQHSALEALRAAYEARVGLAP